MQAKKLFYYSLEFVRQYQIQYIQGKARNYYVSNHNQDYDNQFEQEKEINFIHYSKFQRGRVLQFNSKVNQIDFLQITFFSDIMLISLITILLMFISKKFLKQNQTTIKYQWEKAILILGNTVNVLFQSIQIFANFEMIINCVILIKPLEVEKLIMEINQQQYNPD